MEQLCTNGSVYRVHDPIAHAAELETATDNKATTYLFLDQDTLSCM